VTQPPQSADVRSAGTPTEPSPPVPADDPAIDLRSPEFYINRELSLLEFNRRVLAQAQDESLPLLERLRFLSICSTNLDEFFEIRVAGLKQQVAFGVHQTGPDGIRPAELLRRVSETAHALVTEQYRVLNEDLLPALEAEGIGLIRRGDWSSRQSRWIERYFRSQVLPVLTPMALDPVHPFPRVLNKGLNFIVSVEGKDAYGRDSGIAIVQVPRSLPRVIRLPEELARHPHDFVLLSSIIHAHVEDLFPGMKSAGCHQFRVTRNSDLWVDEEEVDNLMHALQGELPTRNFGAAVRLEVADTCSSEMAEYLLEQVDLDAADLYSVNGPVNLHRLAAIVEAVDERVDLRFPEFVPGTPRHLQQAGDLFEAIQRGDLLLHHPYESFAPVIDLVRQASTDPNVLAIKQTLYRTDSGSPMVDALIAAARAGKEVTAVVELRARFDEAANIDLANRLQEVGANVVYGIVGYKTHAKMLMVVRREGSRLRRYCHLGTGNYHGKTARAYTDIGLITCSREIGEDVHRLFLQLTGLGKVKKLKHLLQSPFTLYKTLVDLIETETEKAEAGKPARIVAKMNSLSEPAMIRALYRASQAGVKIELIVRGICCLRPGVKGVSETISVRSIVGRFLEHHRIYRFGDGEHGRVLASSADWMSRNLFRRVEACFPIDDPDLSARVTNECLEASLADNTQAWLLQSEGTYRRTLPGKSKPRSVQQSLLEQLADGES
jgi:polyphosphate kinase